MKISLLILALMFAGCDRNRPPAPTAEQSNQLDEAEALLDNLAANEKGAAPAGTAPSYSN